MLSYDENLHDTTPFHLLALDPSLVDCPGHASLIRTIIGGAQIIDMVLLVVDAFKGWQAQTTECLVLAELTSRHVVVALNKVDLFAENEREERLEKAKKAVRQRLAGLFIMLSFTDTLFTVAFLTVSSLSAQEDALQTRL